MATNNGLGMFGTCHTLRHIYYPIYMCEYIIEQAMQQLHDAIYTHQIMVTTTFMVICLVISKDSYQ